MLCFVSVATCGALRFALELLGIGLNGGGKILNTVKGGRYEPLLDLCYGFVQPGIHTRRCADVYSSVAAGNWERSMARLEVITIFWRNKAQPD
jgi:hypothetical protein